MSRRTSLPGADELFRATGRGAAPRGEKVLAAVPDPGGDDAAQESRAPGRRRPSGRQRHDEKITVYVSADELLELERARLSLRADHGIAVDRGRIVREAVAVVLAELEDKGEDSVLVRRLRGDD